MPVLQRVKETCHRGVHLVVEEVALLAQRGEHRQGGATSLPEVGESHGGRCHELPQGVLQ
jgi:hypothetical protein